MANPGEASGSGNEKDTTSPNEADKLLATSVQGAHIRAPRVTLTIELGSLTQESIGAIAEFVKAALSASPATAIGRASAKPDAPVVASAKPDAPQGASGANPGEEAAQ